MVDKSTDLHRWTCYHFSGSNPSGPGQGNVPRLLRTMADAIEACGDIEVQDITFHSTPTADENDLIVTVYYTLPDLYVLTGNDAD